MKRSRPSRPLRRAGIAYLLTMLYLMLFSVLAIGLAAASTLSVQLANADRCAADAQSAAESGLEFVRYQLGHIVIPPDTTDANLLPEISTALAAQLDGSPTMNRNAVRIVANSIELPAANDCITLDPTVGTKFHAQITTNGSAVCVKIAGHGRGDTVTRAIELEFQQTNYVVNGAMQGMKLVPAAGSYEEVSP